MKQETQTVESQGKEKADDGKRRKIWGYSEFTSSSVKVHPQMSIYDRAAQFSPFAALTGHEAAIKETARLTEEQVNLMKISRKN